MIDIIKGEIELDFGGVTYTLKANIGSLQAIEAELGENIFPIYDRFSLRRDGKLTPNVGANDISAVIGNMLKCGGSQLTRKQMDAILDSQDFVTLAMVCKQLLNVALSSGEARGKMKEGVTQIMHELLKSSHGESSTKSASSSQA